jgi:hypothetical protein
MRRLISAAIRSGKRCSNTQQSADVDPMRAAALALVLGVGLVEPPVARFGRCP